MKKIILILLLTSSLLSCHRSRQVETDALPFVVLPAGTTYEILIDSGILNHNGSIFFPDYDNRPCIYAKGKVVELDSIDQNGYEPMLIPDSNIRQLCYLSGERFATLTGNRVVCYTNRSDPDTLWLPHDSLHMSGGSKEILYLYGYNTASGQYDLYRYRTNEKTNEKLFTTSEPITTVSGTDQWAFLATGHSVFFIGEGKAHQVLYSEEPVQTLACSGKGYFYSTDSIVGYSFGSDKEVTFMYNGAQSLWATDQALYLLSGDGMLAKIAPVDRFEEFTHTIDSIRKHH